MKYTNELMLMIAKFLRGETEVDEFSFEFPARLAEVFDDFRNENADLCDCLEEEMPDLCAMFDPHETGGDTMNAEQFRAKIMSVYQKALPLAEICEELAL